MTCEEIEEVEKKRVKICEQRYGSMSRKSTTDVVFALRMLMYREDQKIKTVFTDLEKVDDRVLRKKL